MSHTHRVNYVLYVSSWGSESQSILYSVHSALQADYALYQDHWEYYYGSMFLLKSTHFL